ncbi:hypothetical protein HW115_10105 [Verrucomicrobiaceae bacterium N1E253]|uniref:Uncharacterized protein n=1 Tax=Oceaniferula marina TaxID=2748318 RepID=A0A851GEW8_9BACT|nr:hypothetical protein [Oceaniferula marina]NWK55966.1 hypothetical protein [Oceaniferula marina]
MHRFHQSLKRAILTCSLTTCLIAPCSFAGNSFGIKELKIDETMQNRFMVDAIYYSPSCSRLINTVTNDHWRILKFRLTASSDDWYFLDFNNGQSDDPTFVISPVKNPKQSSSFTATTLHIPGNGHLYFERTMNSYLPVEKGKIVRTEDGFEEQQQPFYAINLKTKTLKPVQLYGDEACTKVIAKLGIGAKVTALVARPNSPHILVQTPFGLTGWIKDASTNSDLDGIAASGD